MNDSSDDVIVLSLVPFRDHDVIVKMLGKTMGRVGAFARAARKSQKRLPGLQPMVRGTATFITRSGMPELTSFDVDNRLQSLSSDLETYALAAYIVELVERFLPEGEIAAEAFSLVEDALLALAPGHKHANILSVRGYELRFLHMMGVLPSLDVDDDLACVAYDPASCMFLPAETSTSVPFSAAAMSAARTLLASTSASWREHHDAIDVDVAKQVSRLFSSWLRRQPGLPLRSLAFYRQVQGPLASSG
jgi:DNA repair protein RecO